MFDQIEKKKHENYDTQSAQNRALFGWLASFDSMASCKNFAQKNNLPQTYFNLRSNLRKSQNPRDCYKSFNYKEICAHKNESVLTENEASETCRRRQTDVLNRREKKTRSHWIQ